jgi:membrane protein DedA with SNARE-associated domain
MDFLPDLSHITSWLIQYGAYFIFVAFALGILILPVPEETMMLIAGHLIRDGRLELPSIALGAFLGAITGITLSYIIGRSFGYYVIHRFGKYFGITSKRLKKAHAWFEKYGKWGLLIGYFIPGVRHFTGISAGATKLDLKKFMLFAYCGALIWVFLFISIGYHFGHVAIGFFKDIELTSDHIILLLVGIALIFFGIKIYRKKSSKK